MKGEKRDPGALSKRHLDHLRAFVVIVLILAAVSAFAAADRYHESRNADPARVELNDFERRSILVGETGFRIPIAYFHPLATPLEGSAADDVLLDITLPDIGPLTETKTELYRRGQSASYGSLMIQSPNINGHRRKKLAEFAEAIIRYRNTTEQAPTLYGLNRLVQPGPFKRGRDEILYDGNRDEPSTFLICSQEEEGIAPQCKMHFNYSDLIVRVRFSRNEFLSEWKKIKENALARITEFHLEHNQEK